MAPRRWSTPPTPHLAYRLSDEYAALVEHAFGAIDRLYAGGRPEAAEDLDAMVDELLDELDAAGAELDAESADVQESGVEDYEVDECSDEGFLDGTATLHYWEPWMLVASDDAA